MTCLASIHSETGKTRAEQQLDPSCPAAAQVQAKIAERIRQEQVEHNYEQAMEHNPEVRGSTVTASHPRHPLLR